MSPDATAPLLTQPEAAAIPTEYHAGVATQLAALAAQAQLVDEFILMIEPITLGGGKTLFPVDGQARRFELTSATTTDTGVQVCRYRPVP